MRVEDKHISVKYTPSSDFSQMKFLYQCLNQISDENGVPNALDAREFMGPVSVTLISEYKTPIYTITYHDAWLDSIGKLDLDYQSGENTLTQTFGFTYSHYTVDGLLDELTN